MDTSTSVTGSTSRRRVDGRRVTRFTLPTSLPATSPPLRRSRSAFRTCSSAGSVGPQKRSRRERPAWSQSGFTRMIGYTVGLSSSQASHLKVPPMTQMDPFTVRPAVAAMAGKAVMSLMLAFLLLAVVEVARSMTTGPAFADRPGWVIPTKRICRSLGAAKTTRTSFGNHR